MWVLRHLIIPAGFMWAAGIFNIDLHSANTKSSTADYHHFTQSEYAALEFTPTNALRYCDSLIALRKEQVKRTGMYLPIDYFHDLRQFDMFTARYYDSLSKLQSSRNVTRECVCVFYRCCSGVGALNDLVNLRDGNWRTSEFEKRHVQTPDQARAFWFPKEAAEEQKPHNVPSRDWFWKSLMHWMMRLYVHGLPFAFVMLIVWRVRLKKTLQPMSFVFSLLMWPIILFLDIRNRFISTWVRAEVLSRRDTMLGILSKGDHALVKFGMQMSRKEFRSYLDSIGMARKHSMRRVLAVMLFVAVFLPRTYAQTHVRHVSKHTVTAVSTHAGVPDCDIGAWQYTEAVPPDTQALWIEQEDKKKFQYPLTIGRVILGYRLLLDGVPKVSIAF